MYAGLSRTERTGRATRTLVKASFPSGATAVAPLRIEPCNPRGLFNGHVARVVFRAVLICIAAGSISAGVPGHASLLARQGECCPY